MSDVLVVDVCKHGVRFYPGLAEKEKCCKYCAALAQSGPTMLPIEPEKCHSRTVLDLMKNAERGSIFSTLTEE